MDFFETVQRKVALAVDRFQKKTGLVQESSLSVKKTAYPLDKFIIHSMERRCEEGTGDQNRYDIPSKILLSASESIDLAPPFPWSSRPQELRAGLRVWKDNQERPAGEATRFFIECAPCLLPLRVEFVQLKSNDGHVGKEPSIGPENAHCVNYCWDELQEQLSTKHKKRIFVNKADHNPIIFPWTVCDRNHEWIRIFLQEKDLYRLSAAAEIWDDLWGWETTITFDELRPLLNALEHAEEPAREVLCESREWKVEPPLSVPKTTYIKNGKLNMDDGFRDRGTGFGSF